MPLGGTFGLAKIDTATSAVVATVAAGAGAGWTAHTDDAVWVSNSQDGNLYPIDVATDTAGPAVPSTARNPFVSAYASTRSTCRRAERDLPSGAERAELRVLTLVPHQSLSIAYPEGFVSLRRQAALTRPT